MRDLPFAEQYAAWQRARWHLGLGEGPVDVLGTRGDTLLAAWFAGTGQVCYTRISCSALPGMTSSPSRPAQRDAVQGMRHASGKRRALDSISKLLRLWRLPARGAKVTRWPGRAAGCTAASALEDVRAHLTQKGRRLWRWVRGRTRVVLPRCQTYSSHWNHIRSSKASDMLALLATGVAEQPPCAKTQASTVRVKRYSWKLPVAVAPAQALRQGRVEVRAWAQKCFGASFRSPGPAGACHRVGLARPDEAGPVLDGPKPSDELTHYKTHLTKPAEGEVPVQEYKDKSAAWRMPTQLYLHWVAHLLVADTVHWRRIRVDCSVQEVNALYRHLHRGVLPRRFAYMASSHRWAGLSLNYMYMNLKAKCFVHLQGRTCQKPGHSCLHKAVGCQLVLAPGSRLLPLAGPRRPDARCRLGQGT